MESTLCDPWTRANLFSRWKLREFCGVEGVFRHSQIVENEAGLAVEFTHGGGDAIGMSSYDPDGEAAESGGVFGAVSGSDAAAVLVPGGVEDVVDGLGGPVSAVEREQSLRVGGVGASGW